MLLLLVLGLIRLALTKLSGVLEAAQSCFGVHLGAAEQARGKRARTGSGRTRAGKQRLVRWSSCVRAHIQIRRAETERARLI